MPESGGTPSKLFAYVSQAATGTQAYTVEVLNLTTGVVSLACTIDATADASSTTTSCWNSGSGISAAQGDYLGVRITDNAPSRRFRVSFRY
jgi:hypothetical protein